MAGKAARQGLVRCVTPIGPVRSPFGHPDGMALPPGGRHEGARGVGRGAVLKGPRVVGGQMVAADQLLHLLEASEWIDLLSCRQATWRTVLPCDLQTL